MARLSTTLLVLAAIVQLALGFRALGPRKSGVKLSMMLDGAAELGLALKLASANIQGPTFADQSFTIAKVETKQGMYKEYTVETTDDSYLDVVKRGYKSADETEDSKTKYWAILGVLLFGSFTIPMAQYYWYIAEEDD